MKGKTSLLYVRAGYVKECPNDLGRIKASVEATIGFGELNKRVIDRMRAWMAVAGSAALAKLPAGDEKAASPLHDSVAGLLRNLGHTTEAEALFRETLAARRRLLGPENELFMWTASQLRTLLVARNATAEALAIAREVLEICERTRGANHIETVRAVRNLAGSLYAAGRDPESLNQAEALYRRALADFEALLGPSHETTIDLASDFGEFLRNRQKVDEAEVLQRRAVEGAIARVAATSTGQLLVYMYTYRLASLCYQRRRFQEAVDLYRKAHAGLRKVLGEDNVSSIEAASNLGLALHALNRLDEAEPLYRDSLERRLRVLGPNHSSTLGTMVQLAGLVLARGKVAEAESLLHKAIPALRASTAFTGTLLLDALGTLSSALVFQGKNTEAEPICREALEGLLKVYGPRHHGIATSMQTLAQLLVQRGALKEAEEVVMQTMTAAGIELPRAKEEERKQEDGAEGAAVMPAAPSTSSHAVTSTSLHPLAFACYGTLVTVLEAAGPSRSQQAVVILRALLKAEADQLSRSAPTIRRRIARLLPAEATEEKEVLMQAVRAGAAAVMTAGPHKHPLVPVKALGAYPGNRANCDACGLDKLDSDYHCTTCGFDLCAECYDRFQRAADNEKNASAAGAPSEEGK
jgi:tetratricopeptide (TPR) repeat protein